MDFDPLFYMPTATFPPKVPVTVKYGREAYCQVISNFTRYFQTDLDCDGVILDIRSNIGGSLFALLNLAEFLVMTELLWVMLPGQRKTEGILR